MTSKIYTVDLSSSQVIMVSDGKNSYSNIGWVDYEMDESYFNEWTSSNADGDKSMFYRDGKIVIE